ncbi:MAG: cob(I)yrinic acid a,c-diamide adenosyltransferase [Calditrichaceae bacterium]|nr:cob(I)yrinic acid a,c-diamide adenosyltransferase [Calditrichaceae bacterium]RQV92436.1 MAG: cob(I)yrinic acid a,c-diamide adenosyltransferase [Calditrichota bacterium]
MKIYTGFGDRGDTMLLGGKKVKKYDLRVHFYGTLDELNAFTGWLKTKAEAHEPQGLLTEIQDHLFILSAEAASPDEKSAKLLPQKINGEQIKFLEDNIDRISSQLSEVKQFILPGGAESAVIAHICRAVCRRAERFLSELTEKESIRQDLLVYLNRLGDLFFVLGRYFNHLNGFEDALWNSGRKVN